MDTIIDFKLSNNSHKVTPQQQSSPNTDIPFPSNLNLNNLNMNDLNLASLLLKSFPLITSTAPTLSNQINPTNTNLLNELISTNFADNIPIALKNLNIPLNSSNYNLLLQHHKNKQQNQNDTAAAVAVLAAQTLSVNTPPPSVDSSVVSAISPFDVAKNVLVKALNEAAEVRYNNPENNNANFLNQDYDLRPLTKRLKLSNPFSKSATNLNQQINDFSNKTPAMSLELNSILNPDNNLPITAATSLMNLHFGSNTATDAALSVPSVSPPLPPTPTRSMSIASSSVSSTQNSPISLKKSSLGSTPKFLQNKSTTPQRRPAAPIPDSLKDTAYYERRKKNNDAAKRSRDSRRQKEEVTALRASTLEKENIELRNEVDYLKAKVARYQLLFQTNFNKANNFSTTNSYISVPTCENSINVESENRNINFIDQRTISKSAFLPFINNLEQNKQEELNNTLISNNKFIKKQNENIHNCTLLSSLTTNQHFDNNNNTISINEKDETTQSTTNTKETTPTSMVILTKDKLSKSDDPNLLI